MKTIKDVCVDNYGMPIVEMMPDTSFNVLCYGNDGNCKGCRYQSKGWRCGCACHDKDHLYFINYSYGLLQNLKNTRIKRAKFNDNLITCENKKYVILETTNNKFELVNLKDN